LGGTFIPNSINQIYYDIQTADMRDKEDEDFAMPYNDDADDPARIKPILRRLEDMTEVDARDFLKQAIPGAEYVDHNDFAVIWKSQGSRADIWFLHAPPAAFRYLLQQQFDLFGLIDAGLAIDAKTLG